MTDEEVKRWRMRITRDGALFVGGMLGAAHEILVMKGERPGVLALLAAMLGLPAFLRRDEKVNEK